jgi:hypothetical protein
MVIATVSLRPVMKRVALLPPGRRSGTSSFGVIVPLAPDRRERRFHLGYMFLQFVLV